MRSAVESMGGDVGELRGGIDRLGGGAGVVRPRAFARRRRPARSVIVLCRDDLVGRSPRHCAANDRAIAERVP